MDINEDEKKEGEIRETDEEKKTEDNPKPEVKEDDSKMEPNGNEISEILNGKTAKNNGFIYSVPKEFQEEAKEYSNMKEYLRHLHGNDVSWEDLTGDESLKEKKDMLAILKDGGMTASKAKEFVSAYDSYNEMLNRQMEANLDSTMKEFWGKDYDRNKEFLKKGVEVWKNNELINRFPSLRNNPIVADLLCEIGKANGDPSLLDAGKLPEKKKKDTGNKFGIDFSDLM